MDRKKIYIVIIIVCFALTGIVLWYNFKSTSSTSNSDVIVNTNSPVSSGSAGAKNNLIITSKTGEVIYTAPTVFPTDKKFDWTLLQSSDFQTKTQNPPVTLDPSEVGRPDPLQPY